jgi:conjugal transfer pilus assembly protein TraW
VTAARPTRHDRTCHGGWANRALCAGALGLLLTGSALGPPPAVGAPDEPVRLEPVAPPETYGPVFPIIEEDMRTTIESRYKAKLPELQEEARDSLRRYRVPHIPRPTTDTAREVLVDPSITLPRDILAPDGRTVAKAGDSVNPLTMIPLSRAYLVINAEDPRQLAWAVQTLAAEPTKAASVFLTEGSLDVARAALPTRVGVYPAPSQLFERFPIAAVPARLSKAGLRLKIQFVPESDLP